MLTNLRLRLISLLIGTDLAVVANVAHAGFAVGKRSCLVKANFYAPDALSKV
ncbi:hypothetical protein [Inquilinus sp.]|uniref:hypothetical protein n=1 Tax=Inquilinus sp. TaxID=1932117 RepID=UPI0031E0BB02